MGHTVDEALVHAEDALRDYVIEMEKSGWDIAAPSAFQDVETPAGNQLVSIPLIRISGKSVRAGLTLDEGVAEFIDSEASRRNMTPQGIHHVDGPADRGHGGLAPTSPAHRRCISPEVRSRSSSLPSASTLPSLRTTMWSARR